MVVGCAVLVVEGVACARPRVHLASSRFGERFAIVAAVVFAEVPELFMWATCLCQDGGEVTRRIRLVSAAGQ